jgi:imidazolonepropionase-like amidohydrolase
MPTTYITARATVILREMLERGFTTVRDTAGADWGLAAAVDEGWLPGPRVIFGGPALTQTGGHGDFRLRGSHDPDQGCCLKVASITDGADEVRKAARELLRTGAHHVKIMLSGGVASPHDHIDSLQTSDDEIHAAVSEATAAGRYVVGHAYTSAAIERGLRAGVRSIEHGNLMEPSTVPLFLEHDAFYVPTLVTYSAMATDGAALGLPPASLAKNQEVLDAGLNVLDMTASAGVNVAFGTDLLGDMHRRQNEEFTIRAQVQKPADILRSATTVAARLIRREHELGQVEVGFLADLLLVNGDPLHDVSVLAAPEKSLRLVMKAGRVSRDEL